MSDFKAKIHQIRFRLGLRPRPRWGSFERSPDLPTGLRDPNSKWRGGSWEKGRGGRAVREGKGKGWGGGREGEGLDQLKYSLGKFAGRDQRSNHCATPPSGGLRGLGGIASD